MKPKNRPPPENCPNCGEDVPRNALACPGCGSDYDTGWNEESQYDGLDLPTEEFDYEEFTKREFGNNPKPTGLSNRKWLVMILMSIVTAIVLIFMLRR
jgi:uncharacterized membrane protein YvbJ